MKKFIFMTLIALVITAFISGCCSACKNPDGIKSETYTKKTTKAQELIVE
jgi:uncharacterized protein YceK